MKLLIISNRVAGSSEAVVDGQTGFLAESVSPRALAKTLKRAIARKKEWSKLAETGYQRYARLFRSDISVQKLADRYYPS